MTNRNPLGTTQLVVKAVQENGQRTILLSGWAKMGQMTLPPTILCLPNVPHS